jgi:CubicO group peptidase (beta-lactamase class C family)
MPRQYPTQRLIRTRRLPIVAPGPPGGIGSLEDEGRTIRRVTGVGNLSTGRPPRPVQTFRVASQTKVFVSTTSGLYDLRFEHWTPRQGGGSSALGLRHTWFPADTAALPPPRLHGYMPLDTEPPLVNADITRFNPSFFWASGALVANDDDLDRFYDALFDGRLLPRRLLAERTPAWSPTSTRPRTRSTRPSSTPWWSCSAT